MRMPMLVASAALCLALAPFAAAADDAPIKIAFVDALSGPAAGVNLRSFKYFEFMADRINAAGGVDGRKFQIVPLDSEGNLEKTLLALSTAMDQHIQFIAQGGSSAAANALVRAIDKRFQRNPDDAVLLLDYANADPGLTNDHCSYWHFRFDAEVDMRAKGLISYIAQDKAIKRVYLIDQDYSTGQAFEDDAKKFLPEARSDIKIVGSDLVPLLKVKDFSPYINKIIASGADAVYTSNWGADLSLLIRAAVDGGLNAKFFTFYASAPGMATTLGEAGKEVLQIAAWKPEGVPAVEAMAHDYEQKYDADFYLWNVVLTMDVLTEAIKKAHSAEAKPVAQALEGLQLSTPLGEVTMRKDNHQLSEPLFVVHSTDNPVRPLEKTHFGFNTVASLTAAQTEIPTTCKMVRP